MLPGQSPLLVFLFFKFPSPFSDANIQVNYIISLRQCKQKSYTEIVFLAET